uniref:Protein FAM33A n=1 Tax=Amphiprion percula TaxID=161767 RepID=A0A3P8SX89_AMPPE
METTVEKLEAMENPVVMLENLKVIKAKHSALCAQVKDIAAAQKESMDSIRNNLNSAMELIQHFQQTTDSVTTASGRFVAVEFFKYCLPPFSKKIPQNLDKY